MRVCSLLFSVGTETKATAAQRRYTTKSHAGLAGSCSSGAKIPFTSRTLRSRRRLINSHFVPNDVRPGASCTRKASARCLEVNALTAASCRKNLFFCCFFFTLPVKNFLSRKEILEQSQKKICIIIPEDGSSYSRKQQTEQFILICL